MPVNLCDAVAENGHNTQRDNRVFFRRVQDVNVGSVDRISGQVFAVYVCVCVCVSGGERLLFSFISESELKRQSTVRRPTGRTHPSAVWVKPQFTSNNT